MRPHTASEWAWTAYLSVIATLSVLMIVGQLVRSPGPVQAVERDVAPVECAL